MQTKNSGSVPDYLGTPLQAQYIKLVFGQMSELEQVALSR